MRVKTSQGEVYAEVSGQGPPLVLLHADGASGQEFEPLLGRLEGSFELIRPDLPGCGRSPRRALSPAYYRENAKAALDVARHLHPDRPVRAVGSGGGAVTALWMAILDPERIAGVVADSFAEFYRPDDLAGLLAAHQDPPPELSAYLEQMHGADWPVVVAELDRVLVQMAEQERSVFDWRLEEVGCPVLVTGSRRDQFYAALVPRLLAVVEQLPTAQLILYPEGAHPCMWSLEDRFWADATAFLRACQADCTGRSDA